MKKQKIIDALCVIIIALVFCILLVLCAAWLWQLKADLNYDKSVSVVSVRMAA